MNYTTTVYLDWNNLLALGLDIDLLKFVELTCHKSNLNGKKLLTFLREDFKHVDSIQPIFEFYSNIEFVNEIINKHGSDYKMLSSGFIHIQDVFKEKYGTVPEYLDYQIMHIENRLWEMENNIT